MRTLRAALVGVLLAATLPAQNPFVQRLSGQAPLASAATAQSPLDLAGDWALNRQISEFPRELGFSATFIGDDLGPASGRGRRGDTPGPPRAPRIQTQTEDDSRRVRFLTDEVRLPPDRLAIAVTPATVTLTPDRGAVRTVQPGKRDDSVNLGPMTAVVNAAWEGTRLVVVYRADGARTIRYTYTVTPQPRQLAIDVEFIERGGGDRIRRIYDPAPAEAPPAPAPAGTSSAAAPPPAPAAPGASPFGSPFGGAPSGLPGSAPAAGGAGSSGSGAPAAAVDQRPDAALKGLTRLGVVVEGVDSAAVKCGLTQASLETAVARRLTDGGFRVVRNTDDESYLYVNINTVTAGPSLCVSRYDVTLYSNTAARLEHTAAPVLIQAELLRRGGIAGGAPAGHGAGVQKSVLEYVDLFVTRVKNANP